VKHALIAIAVCLAATAATAGGRWHCGSAPARHVAVCQEYAARYIAYREAFEQRRQEYADQKKMRDKARAKHRQSVSESNSTDTRKLK